MEYKIGATGSITAKRFFDLDAADLSAFVFMLVEAVYSTESTQSSIQVIKAAVDILQYLHDNGNRGAE